MKCPFLKEAQVESCRHSLFRKLIVRNPENLPLEKCSSSRFAECPIYQQEPDDAADGARCPYLDDALAQYCAAAASPKFIPYSEAVLSRCGSDGYRYCDLYLMMAHPDSAAIPRVDGIALPPWLYYAPNHMWLDLGEDGSCHIGIDGLLARLLSSVDRVTFVTGKGICRPAVVLTLRGVDFHMVFPNRILVTGMNLYIRANTHKLASDPYRLGWLFEGRRVPGEGEEPQAGLMHGDEAASRWMESEVGRLNEFVHVQAARTSGGDLLMADGGGFSSDLLEHLERDQTLELFHRFFSPFSNSMR